MRARLILVLIKDCKCSPSDRVARALSPADLCVLTRSLPARTVLTQV